MRLKAVGTLSRNIANIAPLIFTPAFDSNQAQGTDVSPCPILIRSSLSMRYIALCYAIAPTVMG